VLFDVQDSAGTAATPMKKSAFTFNAASTWGMLLQTPSGIDAAGCFGNYRPSGRGAVAAGHPPHPARLQSMNEF